MPRSDHAPQVPLPTRRQALAVGAASFYGVSLTAPLHGPSRASFPAQTRASSFGRARAASSCGSREGRRISIRSI